MIQNMVLHVLRELEQLYRMTVSALKSDVSKWLYVTRKVEPQSHRIQTFEIVSFSRSIERKYSHINVKTL